MARRKFSPEFMNRIDKVIVFRGLQCPHLKDILDIELAQMRERMMSSAAGGKQLIFRCTSSARDSFCKRELIRSLGRGT
jgi:ATP-dependent Clp protease ATP-binding subunit ClpA